MLGLIWLVMGDAGTDGYVDNAPRLTFARFPTRWKLKYEWTWNLNWINPSTSTLIYRFVRFTSTVAITLFSTTNPGYSQCFIIPHSHSVAFLRNSYSRLFQIRGRGVQPVFSLPLGNVFRAGGWVLFPGPGDRGMSCGRMSQFLHIRYVHYVVWVGARWVGATSRRGG
jgi:hypothetical protein